ncbi:hypothetical protein [Polaromonas sp.]|uniref:hypothetical protein n=1 Tax=Polaromonas sp. TaxID=1869339 RepID=UPI003266F74F
MRRLLSLCFANLLLAMCVSCASSYDLAKGERSPLGAGVAVRPIKPGLFAINVQTNALPIANHSGAAALWKELASKACRGTSFEEAQIKSGEFALTGPAYMVATRYGYAVCWDADLDAADRAAFRRGEFSQ